MPKLGMEPIRRAALVEATIAELGAAGSLDITVSQIARRAGVSSALAHHYFGGKEDIFVAAMRHVLTELRREAVGLLSQAQSPRARLDALIAANFAPSSFEPETITAWMQFYALARRSGKAARLLRVYQSRLRSNLCAALRPQSRHPERDAEAIAALIDGIYLRSAHHPNPDAEAARTHVARVVDAVLERRE